MGDRISNYLSIDVEDYFQVAAFDKIVAVDEWEHFESRVERNTAILLSLLEAEEVKATFFIVGWIAERYPNLVKKIWDSGHKIGCHSYMHQKIFTLTPYEFREDTMRAKSILEDITGHLVAGYRAPSYSITKQSLWALDILAELGFTYDSSIFPIYHDNYGIPDSPRFEYKLPQQGLMEYPISTAMFWGQKIPVAGGGYFRLFPYWFSRMALRKINRDETRPFVFYLHPWEVDPTQPRFKNASVLSKFRHYNHLQSTETRFANLLRDFDYIPIPEEH
jgi:polysaccharide deacetylase family protein (PEP-CTERM system associated)